MAFGLPVLSDLLREKEAIRAKKIKKITKKAKNEAINEQNEEENDEKSNKKPKKTLNVDSNEIKLLKALILTPTRELAFQIQKHLTQVLPEKSLGLMTLVGGMSKEKQTRLLSYCPEILVATPGRLWEFIESGQYEYLQTLKALEYLIIDEADKMIELGHFEELDKILGHIYDKHKGVSEEEGLGEGMLKSKHKFTSDAMIPEEFINDIDIDAPTELPNQYYFDEKSRTIRLREIHNDEKNKENNKKTRKTIDFSNKNYNIKPSKKLKTFLVSATLTKNFRNATQRLQNPDEQKKNQKNKRRDPNENPKLQALVHKIRFTTKKPKIIDLSQNAFMPEKLKKYRIFCSDEDKTMYLYSFLCERPTEKTLIFVNTITVARRLTMILQKAIGLKVPPLCLHSHLQQKQRLKKLDEFLTGKNQIIVCTDVAARGLDIPKVENVIHYQIPRDIDTYVHRSGRTARIGSEGVVFSIIGPKERNRFEKIAEQLGEEQETYKKIIKENVRNMINKCCEEVGEEKVVKEGKKVREWFEKQSRETDIELDDGVKKMIGEKKGDKKGKKYEKINRKKQEETKKFRRNAVFLNPEMIREIMEKMKH